MFFQDNSNENEDLIKVCALLIHAAKIDENFSLEEEKIIEQTLLKFKAKSDDLKKIITKAKEIEENSNQILSFTREVKNMSEVNKVKIIEALWQIIYSNNQADIYEMNNQINAVNTMSQILSTYGLNLPFNRQQESDADKTGLRLMAEAGFNPFASLSLWKKMQEDSNRPNLEFVSSHPSSENRIKGLSSQLSEALQLYNAVERKPRCTF